MTITPTRTPDPTRQVPRTTPDAAPVRFDLLRSDGAAALVQDGRTVSHAELADLVEQRRKELGPVRRLVVLDGASTVEAVVDHLACLAGGHVAILVAPGAPSTERLVAAYDPDVVVRHRQGRETEIRRDGSAHELHPDLALLMSTSGSSGSPKLVRISTDNLRANASAIADYLGLDDDDCAATSLPLHYCYGLSVLHSHLLVGGSVWLTDESVVDDAFWDGFVEVGATSLAGVPHSFELLEQSDFVGRQLPRLDRLRRITQAGGALPAPRVAEWAERGRVHGFDFFVMYGATEATARMAYLPPHLAHARPRRSGSRCPAATCGSTTGSSSTPDRTSCSATPPVRRTWRWAAPSTSCTPVTSRSSTTTACSRSSGAAAAPPSCSDCASTSTTSSDCSATRASTAAPWSATAR